MAYTQKPELRDCLYLVKYGVPIDVAFSLDVQERKAWVIVMGEHAGLAYDYARGGWAE